jgi:N utilization substance protein B
MKSPRHQARECVVQALYQWHLTADSAAHLEAYQRESTEFAAADAAFFVALLQGTLKHAEALQGLIQPHLDRPYEALSPVERSILLLATHELRDCPETPYRVVLNEAIELAKEYGGADGHKYVNGVLDKLVLGLRPHEVRRAQQHAKSRVTPNAARGE